MFIHHYNSQLVLYHSKLTSIFLSNLENNWYWDMKMWMKWPVNLFSIEVMITHNDIESKSEKYVINGC